jgi:hypothetical protein
MRLVERLSDHYRINITNRFIRPALLHLPLDQGTWDLIEILTEKYEQFRYQGFPLDELYRQIAALARFVSACRRDVVPGLRYRLSGGPSSGPDKVLRDMAVNTFSANLQLFAEQLSELYNRVMDFDMMIATKDRRPLCQEVPEFSDLNESILGDSSVII